MVLDVKQMEWAAQQGLDTATLKKARIRVYGKWYFPDIPANVPLVNLSNGEEESFAEGFRAGQVLFVERAALQRAGLGPYKRETPEEPSESQPATKPEGQATAGPERQAGQHARESSAEAQDAQTASDPETGAAGGQRPEPAHRSELGAPPAVVLEHHASALAAEHPHPTPNKYIKIAVVLTVITAIEIAVFYLDALKPVLAPVLLSLSALKFTLVAMFYMHLRFDSRLFSFFFGFGLLIAGTILIGMQPLGMDHIVPLPKHLDQALPPGTH